MALDESGGIAWLQVIPGVVFRRFQLVYRHPLHVQVGIHGSSFTAFGRIFDFWVSGADTPLWFLSEIYA